MLFCPSFTQSERILQTEQLITRLQVVVMTNFIRMLMRNVVMNVFKSDAVIWWAAIFHNVRDTFRPCQLKDRLDVRDGDVHRGSFLDALPIFVRLLS